MNSMNTKRKQLQDGKNLWMNCFWRICREERNEWPSFHHSSCFSFFSISFSFFLCGKRWQAQGPSRHGTDGWRALPPVPRVPNDVVVWPFGGRRNRSGSLRRQLRRSPLKKNNNNQKKNNPFGAVEFSSFSFFFQFISISSTFFLLLLPFRAADRRRLCAPALEKEVKSGEPSADTERNIYLLILAFLFFPQLIPLLLPLLLLLLLYFPSSSSSISSGTRAPRSKSDGDVSIFFVSLRLNSVGQPIFRAPRTTKKIGKKKNGKGKTVRSSSSKKREATTVGGGIERDKKKRKKRKLLRHWEGGEEKKWTCGWTAESWRKISPVNVNLATVLITGAHLRTKDLPRVDANGRGRAVDTADWWHSYEKKKFLVESKQNLLTKMGT